ncbi:Uncharacterised protein [Halioglobus japonicus]|nr:Uncharacterised protein [Halioglobus japonicus]
MTNPTIRTIALTTILAAVLGFFMGVYFLKHGLIGTPISIAKLADGAIYTGDIQNGLLHGEGTLRWPEGSFYEGAFKDGLLHGQGEYVDVSGNRYVGQFIEGQFSGRGTIQLKDGGIYEGQTKGWQMDGEGEYRFERSVYRGTFEEDALTGQGEYLEDGELMYRGSFRDWTFHGDGERFEEGGHWQGEFEDGLMTQGTHILDTGGRYEGEVSFRTYHGDGTLTLANGDRYVGEFHYGEYHGEGSMYLAKEQEGIIEYSGKWRDGVLVESPQNHLVKNYEAQLESALYREADLLQEELSRVPAGDPSKVELYFLGIAGDGTQRVFSREVKAFRDYFDNVLPLDARQVNLINDRESIGKRPLATSTSIEQALAKLATSMNLDQDLLVVYISSHGSSEHEISLANEAIRLGDLSATSLSEMLTRSGIDPVNNSV